MIPANLFLPLLALVSGWLALFPARRELGALRYHLFAFPVGLLAWPAVAGMSTLLGSPLSLGIALAAHALFAASVALLARWVRSARHPVPVPGWTWAAWGGLFAGVSALLAYAGLTAIALDSLAHYELSGIAIYDTGMLSAEIMSSRGPLVPSIHAATRLMGGGWTFSPYTLASLTTLALLAVLAYAVAFRRLARGWRIALSLLVPALLALQPAWVFHSFFVHGNMVSAMYLLIAVTALLQGAGRLEEPDGESGDAWWLVAGLATSGIAMTRPDGLAYAFVLLALAFALHARLPERRTGPFAFYAGFAVVVATVYLPVFARIGVWTSFKLQGSWVLALLAGCVAMFGVTLAAPGLGSAGRWLRGAGNAVRLALTLSVVVTLLAGYAFRSQFQLSTANIAGNLLNTGGWGFLWYAVGGMIVLAALYRRYLGLGESEDLLLYAVVQFLLVAFLIHGVVHPGRLNWMDSFNRVSLHVLPVAWLYVMAFLGAAFSSGADEADAAEPPASS